MPQVGIGTWLSQAGEVGEAIDVALQAGVRLVDGAFLYRNEEEIGKALKQWLEPGDRLKRSDVYVVSKLPFFGMRAEEVEGYLDKSLQALQLDYLDLYLIHGPVGLKPDDNAVSFKFMEGAEVEFENNDLLPIWQEMERMVNEGKTKSIGVSNFSSEQVENIIQNAKIKPVVNQVECHAYFQQRKLRETMDANNVKIMAYAPLGSSGRSDSMKPDDFKSEMEDPGVAEIAKAHDKTPAQVLLRHLIQSGLIVIPKSTNEDRIKENFDLFDFELTEEDMKQIDELDKGSQGRTFDFEFFNTKEKYSYQNNFPFIERDEY